MARRRLPIGIQTFRKLREQDCYYVDKTAFIERLLRGGTHYFLSRPRRFGKNLFLDTLKELFEGNEALFAGLYIHDRHNWSERHPVVRLSFGRSGQARVSRKVHGGSGARRPRIRRESGARQLPGAASSGAMARYWKARKRRSWHSGGSASPRSATR